MEYFLSPTEACVHGAGHTMSISHLHGVNGKGDYEYNQTGLQSNVNGKVYPTVQNSISIINDSYNRSNMCIDE